MKRTFLALSGLILLGIYVAACGGYSNPSGTQVSGLTKRVFASNTFVGNLNILDASLDHFSNSLISIGGAPKQMALAQDRSVTLVFNTTGPEVSVVNNSTETDAGGIVLPGANSMVAINNATGFASVRNSQVVDVLDLTNIKISGSISVPTPNQLVLSNDGKKLLVFSDAVPGSITVIDTATAITNPSGAATTVTSASFDHPINGVFSTDNSKAYILSCGVECGGVAANVTVVDMTTAPPTPGASVPVPGATVGLLDSSSLYVAGNSSAVPGTGVLTVVDTGSLTAAAPVAIGDGFHRVMGLDNHAHLFIGATACSQLRCLTFYDTAAKTATVEVNPDPNQNGNGYGDVTGHIQPISGRDRVYVAQGGEIRIFDSTIPAALPSSQQLDAVGFITDLVQVDP